MARNNGNWRHRGSIHVYDREPPEEKEEGIPEWVGMLIFGAIMLFILSKCAG